MKRLPQGGLFHFRRKPGTFGKWFTTVTVLYPYQATTTSLPRSCQVSEKRFAQAAGIKKAAAQAAAFNNSDISITP